MERREHPSESNIEYEEEDARRDLSDFIERSRQNGSPPADYYIGSAEGTMTFQGLPPDLLDIVEESIEAGAEELGRPDS
jgi:hypothetical protein